MFRLYTLGTADIRRATQSGETVSLQPKRLALLAYLSSNRQEQQQRDVLLQVFWPELNARRARSALNQAIYDLRRHFGSDALRSHGRQGVSRNPDLIWCDAGVFEEHLCQDRAEAGLELYRGPFLDGFHVSGCSTFEHWLDRRRADLHRKAIAAASALMDKASSDGDVEGTERWLRKLRLLAPADEEVARRLILLLRGSGRRAAALQTCRTITAYLRHELGMTPSQATTELARELETGDSPGRSVAVLPFSELGPDPITEGFGAGLAEEVRGALACTRSIRVVGGVSANRAKIEGGSLREIADMLGVDTVVEGSVSRISDRLRVTARLVRGSDAVSLWADRYELPYAPARIFDLQEELARCIAVALQSNSAATDGRLRIRRVTSNTESYAAYLEGRHAWRRRTPESLHKALSLFRTSLDRDPGNALAWSGLADTYAVLPIYESVDVDDHFEQALDAAARALELDPTLAEARTSLARVYFNARRWEDAEVELRRAIETNPSYAPARHWLADLLMRTGRRDEALEEADRLVALEPLSHFAHIGRGFVSFLAREYDTAIEAARRSRSLHDSPQGTFMEAFALLADDRGKEALRVIEAGRHRWPRHIWGRCILGCVLVHLGAADEAHAIARELNDEPGGSFYGAMVQAAFGHADEAFWMLRDVKWDSVEIDLFVSAPPFDPIRSDPRYDQTLADLGLKMG